MRRRVIGICGKKSWGWKIILGAGLIAAFCAAALAADTIAGVARNRTRGQFAAGDEVILLRLEQAHANRGAQVEARTTTDFQGSFALTVRFPDKMHLLRVVHKGVNYDQQVSAGDVVSIDVFDAAAKVQGVAGTIEMIRTGTNGNLLHVSDMVEIRNDSRPPLTQAGKRTFEVFLPAHAKIASVLAAGPGNIGMMISAAPIAGEPGHYSVNFPLRPGATKFAFNYDLAYDGHATFRTRNAYSVQQLLVMIPPTMKFTSRSPDFQVLPTGNGSYRVEAANRVKAGEGLEFEISGVGALPALKGQSPPPKRQVRTLPTPALSASGRSGTQAQGANPSGALAASGLSVLSSRVRWWVLGASALLVLGACGFLLSRRQRPSPNAMTMAAQKAEQHGQTSAPLVEALKGELFQLEIDRLHGTIPGDEYAAARQALEGTVKRALARAGAKP
jgi:hypothetical protein